MGKRSCPALFTISGFAQGRTQEGPGVAVKDGRMLDRAWPLESSVSGPSLRWGRHSYPHAPCPVTAWHVCFVAG